MRLPPLPADLKTCFVSKVPAPEPAALSRAELFGLIGRLKASADDKDRCGRRLVCFYEDVARGLLPERERKTARVSPGCKA